MKFRLLPVLALPVVLSACPKDKQDDSLTFAEAQQAVQEASLASQAENFTSASVEISTNFTIGDAVEKAASDLRDFVGSQLPCADITLQNATLTITYGANAGNCTYKGQTFSGSHSIEVAKNDQAQVEVHHTWTDLSNGKVTLNGNADVTWDFSAKTRSVVHTAQWTRVSDGYTVTGSGNRQQSLLEGGLTEGIQVDGTRTWETPKGNWDLVIQGVQMRWVDPVPQAGSYALQTPFDKTLSLSFERVDEDTIAVTVANGSKKFTFKVTKLGSVSSS